MVFGRGWGTSSRRRLLLPPPLPSFSNPLDRPFSYILLSALTLLIISLTHPVTLIASALTAGMWILHSRTQSLPRVPIAGKDLFVDILTPLRRTYLCSLLTLLAFLFYALVPLLTVFAVAAALCLAHAALRDPRDVERWERGEEEGGEGGGEEERAELFAGARV